MSGHRDPFAEASDELSRRVGEQDEREASRRYKDAHLHLERLINDFVMALRASVISATRIPSSKRWLVQNLADELLSRPSWSCVCPATAT